MRLYRSSEPARLPVTVKELQSHVRIDHDDENAHLDLLINAATQSVEAETGRALVTQTWEAVFPEWPDFPLELPWPPLISVDSVKYLDTDGNEQTWASTNYWVEIRGETGLIGLRDGVTLPELQDGAISPVEITFTAGYGTDPEAVPDDLRILVLMLASHWYENREPVAVGTIASPIPDTLARLAWGRKVMRF